MEETEKVWYNSKTLWANVLVIVIGVLSYVQGEMATGGMITIAGVVNVVLRLVTSNKLVK